MAKSRADDERDLALLRWFDTGKDAAAIAKAFYLETAKVERFLAAVERDLAESEGMPRGATREDQGRNAHPT